MHRKLVRDVMLPLDEYPVVPQDATLLDALRALDAAQATVPPARQPHRAVLVVNARGAIVGKVGQLAFLRGLEPSYQRLGNDEALSRAGLSPEFLTSVMESYQLWNVSQDELRQRARTTRVIDIMRPVAIQVPDDASLSRAIHELVVHQTLSILVTREGTVVGILRLSDVFQEMFDLLVEDEA